MVSEKLKEKAITVGKRFSGGALGGIYTGVLMFFESTKDIVCLRLAVYPLLQSPHLQEN